MSPEVLQTTRFFRNNPNDFTKKMFPMGQRFLRLGLTLSAKGWTASIQWEGTTGCRGTGKAIEEAIDDALKNLSKWDCYATTHPKAKY